MIKRTRSEEEELMAHLWNKYTGDVVKVRENTKENLDKFLGYMIDKIKEFYGIREEV